MTRHASGNSGREKRRLKEVKDDNFDEIDLPSEIKDALLSNGLPSETAVAAAEVLQQAAATKLLTLVQGVTDVDHEIEKLQAKRRKLRNKMMFHDQVFNACKTVLAPIRHIPCDVIREIISHTIEKYPSGSIRSAPVSLARVSSTWRSVVLNSPRLWTSLYLVIKPSKVGDCVKCALLVQEYFKRAKGLPLTFFFYIDGSLKDISSESNKFRVFLRDISPYMSCVRHLGIGSRHSVEAIRCFIDATWKLDALERVDCHGTTPAPWPDKFFNENDESGRYVTLFNKASSLTTAIIEDYLISPTTSSGSWSMMLPWSQLTCIKVSRELSLRKWIKTLEFSPRLQSGTFLIGQGQELQDTIGLDQHIAAGRTHRYIEHLALEISVPPDIPLIGILQIFNLPKLVKLEIKSLRSKQVPPPSLRLPLGVKQLKSLRSLSLSGLSDYPMNYINGLLSQTVNLRKLSIVVYSNADLNQMIRHMVYTEPHDVGAQNEGPIPNILTRLGDLHICCLDRVQPISISALTSMLRSRSEDVPMDCKALQKFVLAGLRGTKLFPEIERKLRKLNAAMKIYLPHHPLPLEKSIDDSVFNSWNPRGKP